MLKFFNQYKVEIIIFISITVGYFALRLPHLTLQPIFVDEAIYIRWAQIMKAEPGLRFVSMTDGKPPLFMWVMIPLFKVFSDPLFAGRLLSVFTGFATLLGVFFLGWRSFNLRVGLWGAFLMAVTPFIVFFDRMALVDTMLAAFSIWSLNLALVLIRYPRIDLAMFLGYSLGGGLLTKPPAFFSIISLPAVLVLFNWKLSDRQWKLLKMFGLWMLAVIIAMAIYSILRLGPDFASINSRNQDYVFSPLEIIGRPLDPFIPHLKDLADWFPKLFTWPILVLVAAGFTATLIRRNRYALAILLWSLIPLMIQMFLLKTFTARYILTSIPPLLCLAAWAIDLYIPKIKLKKYFSLPLVGVLLLIWPLYMNIQLLTAPQKADLPKSERHGYLEDWTAGYGFKEIAQYLADQGKNGLVVVGTEGSFGTLPDGLQIYLDKNRQVVIIGGKASVSAQIRQAATEHPTYFVTNKSRFLYVSEGLKLIKEFPKAKNPNGYQDAIFLFQVSPLTSPQDSTSSSAKL